MQFDDERQWASILANRLGVTIPDDIRVNYWSLPLLEKIIFLLEDRDILNESNGSPEWITTKDI